jgi:hypothetical protein
MAVKESSALRQTRILRTIKARIGGYEESLRSAKLPRAKSLLLSSPAETKASLSELFASRNRPDGLFTANNASTIWVIETLRDMKIKIGKDVSLVGIDDVDFYTLITPPITAVRQPAAELGRVSVRLLMQRIKGDSSPSESEQCCPYRWLFANHVDAKEGGSVAIIHCIDPHSLPGQRMPHFVTCALPKAGSISAMSTRKLTVSAVGNPAGTF